MQNDNNTEDEAFNFCNYMKSFKFDPALQQQVCTEWLVFFLPYVITIELSILYRGEN